MNQQQKTAEYNAWLRAKVERSRASADAGNLVPAAEVESRFAARRAKTRQALKCQFFARSASSIRSELALNQLKHQGD